MPNQTLADAHAYVRVVGLRVAGNLTVMTDPSPEPPVLNGDERDFLRAALLDWGGSARPTDELAVALGFSSAERISDEAWALWGRIEAGESLTQDDWRRVLLATEVVFASDVVGSGLDWRYTAGFSDEQSIKILRGLQRKLPRWRDSVQFDVNRGGRIEVADPDRPNA